MMVGEGGEVAWSKPLYHALRRNAPGGPGRRILESSVSNGCKPDTACLETYLE